MGLLRSLLLAALVAPGSGIYHYRTPDGIDHYVGSAEDVPPAYRRSVRPVDLTRVSINRDLEGRLEAQERSAIPVAAPPPPKTLAWLPSLLALLGATAVVAATTLLLRWLRERGLEGSAWATWSVLIGTWLTALGAALIALRLAQPFVGPMKQRLGRFSLSSLSAEEDRNSDTMRAAMLKAARKAAGIADPAKAPPRPSWSGAPPQ